jgi:sugar phosphate isomerase/epimerase
MREIVIPTFYSLSQPIPQTLSQLAEAGVKLVELHGDAPDRHIDLTDKAAIDALAEFICTAPIKIHSVHCAFSMPSEETWDISQPDESKRKAALQNRRKVIEAGARLEAHHVVVHPGVRHRSKECLTNSCESLNLLAEHARAAGVKMAVENLPPDHLGGSLEEIKRVLDGLDPAVVGFCLDTGHAMLGDDSPGDYIRSLGQRLLGIHWHGNNGAEDAHQFPEVSLGEWDDFFAALNEVGYDLPITLEAVPSNGTSLESALQSIRAVLQESCPSGLSI